MIAPNRFGMYVKTALIALLSIILLETTSFSQTILSGSYVDASLTRENSPYLVMDSAVFDGTKLFIERGVIITFKYHPDPEKKAYIRITAPLEPEPFDGGPGPQVIFTSERDNAPYDLNGDSTSSRPAAGDWGYIEIDPKYADEYDYSMDNVTIRYGGGKKFKDETDPGLYPMTVVSDYNEQGRYFNKMTFRSCVFERSAGVGILAGMAKIYYSKVSQNNYGIRMLSSDTEILHTEIFNNRIYPVYLIDPLIKRDGNEDYNTIIENFGNNEVYDNGVLWWVPCSASGSLTSDKSILP